MTSRQNPTPTEEMLKHLREFNRKERYHLVSMALGNPKFRLGPEFRQKIKERFGLDVPEDSFAAMDYHLDWIYASIYLAATGDGPGPYFREAELVTGNQQDIDFLVISRIEGKSHVIALEAKGFLGEDPDQTRDKVMRLVRIFGTPEAEALGLLPHFGVVQTQPPRMNTVGWPPWAINADGTPLWIELPCPEILKKVQRCDQFSTPAAQGTHWRIINERQRDAGTPNRETRTGRPATPKNDHEFSNLPLDYLERRWEQLTSWERQHGGSVRYVWIGVTGGPWDAGGRPNCFFEFEDGHTVGYRGDRPQVGLSWNVKNCKSVSRQDLGGFLGQA